MKFLVDASSDARIFSHLLNLGHDVTRIGTHHPAELEDEQILTIAHQQKRILITDDRDFGELVFRLRKPHTGVIYLRLSTTAIEVCLQRLNFVLTHHSDQLDQFLTVTNHSVRPR